MKKKIFMITLAACLIVLSIAGSSLAYFTDVDEKQAVVFTAGNVDITLDYDVDDNTKRLYPGKICGDNATIENIGTEKAYVGAIIEITTTATWDAIKTVFKFNDEAKHIETTTGYTVFVVVEDELAIGASTIIPVTMEIPANWGNAELAAFNNITVKVTAYATQTVGFANAETALTTAFGDDAWENYPTANNA